MKIPENPATPDILYRYEETRWSLGVDEFDDPLPGYKLTVDLREYEVIKRTPKGAWIRRDFGIFSGTEKRFIRLDARKKFACNTPAEALESFKARKSRQIRILKWQLSQAEKAIKIADGIKA